MTKSKNTKRALLVSTLFMLLCLTMLIGSTFAWFTDSVTNSNNRVVAGNLKIDLLDADGSELEEGKLFGADLLWEPGQMYYRELKVVNKGTLAAKFNVCINQYTFGCNYVLFPNEVGEDGEQTYSVLDDEGIDYSLSNVIRVAVYPGLFKDLKAETVAATGKTYESDRDMLRDALDYEVIANDIFSVTDSNGGGLLKQYNEDGDCEDYTLLPKGEKNEDGTAGDEKVFTLIAYWALDGDWIYEDFGHVDDDYNMNNGKVATDILVGDEYDLYFSEAFEEGRKIPASIFGDNLKKALMIEFDITVFAAQTSHEADSFDNTYDDDDKDINYVDKDTLLPPGID